MIHGIRPRATKEQMAEILQTFGTYVKLAVDIRRGILAGGGTLHADCEAVLLEDDSQLLVWQVAGAEELRCREAGATKGCVPPKGESTESPIDDPTARPQGTESERDLAGCQLSVFNLPMPSDGYSARRLKPRQPRQSAWRRRPRQRR